MLKKMRVAAATLLASSVLAGCGVTLNSGAVRGQGDGFGPGPSRDMVLEREAQSLGMPPTGMPGFHGMHGSVHQFLRRGAQKLGLTEDQKGELRKIAQARSGDRAQHRAEFEKYRAELKTLLTADRVDEAALRGFIDARKKDAAAHVATIVDTASDMRAVLTDKQRADLVALMNDDTVKRDFAGKRMRFEGRYKPRLEEFRKSLNLSAEQSAALDAVKQKLIAQRESARPAMKQALGSFMQTGDKAALSKALLDGLTGRVPTDELVKVAAVLDKGQRVRIVEHFAGARKRMKHHHMRGFHRGAVPGMNGEV